jgi:hypothetical protein
VKTGYTAVWKQVTPELAQELIAFWQANKVLVEPGAAATRALQAVCIARDEAGALCGVATATLKVLPRLRQPMYYYRQFFAPSLRGQHQELAFFKFAKGILQEHNAAQPQAESLGILLEIENAKIASAYRRVHEPGFDATFIGYSPRGLQLRVSWFDGAELLPPAPVRVRPVAGRAAGGNAPRTQPESRHGNGRS